MAHEEDVHETSEVKSLMRLLAFEKLSKMIKGAIKAKNWEAVEYHADIRSNLFGKLSPKEREAVRVLHPHGYDGFAADNG